MNRESLLDSIQRLLALSGSPNQHEAESALAKAQELMLRHQITIAEVETADVGQDDWVDVEAVECSRTPPFEVPFVTEIVAKFFFVRAYWNHRLGRSGKQLHFFGNAENVQVAVYVFTYLRRVYRRLWRVASLEHGLIGRYMRGYYAGVSDGLNAKLVAEREVVIEQASSNALMVIQSTLDRRFEDKFPNLKPHPASKPVDYCAGRLGYGDGQQIDLRDAIEDGDDQKGGQRAIAMDEET